MRVLVLGGTAFVGRAIVEEALRVGAEVTLFGRGRTGVGLFPGVPRLLGDRDTGDYTTLEALVAAHGAAPFDAVVDVSGYVSRHVRQAMDALRRAEPHMAGRSSEFDGRYLFISSHAVYVRTEGGVEGGREDGKEDGVEGESGGGGHFGTEEDTPRRPPAYDVDEVALLDNSTYGPAKVACEDLVRARYGDRATLVRPGKIGGPHDPSDMFTYWVRRAARGGRVALPGDPDQPVQLLDVRDLARLVVRLLLDDRGGAFHAVGPAEPVTLRTLIETCARAAGAEVEVVPVHDPERPPLFPLVREDRAGQRRDPARARAAGLTATPLAETAADVRKWDLARGEPPLANGYTADREAQLLAEAGDFDALHGGRQS